MKVCGFTFIRNAVKFDYPIVEAIKSILPLCDGFVVAVGNSDDETLALIRSIDPRIIIVETVWDEALKQGGIVFAAETNKAMQAIPREYDWAFYIQGDEVVHEQYLPAIRAAMVESLPDKQVDGLLLNYLHFYGSYDFVGQKYSWYRREIRIVRNRSDIFSYRDAQGFRKKPNDKLRVRLVDAYIYHYGWTRDPGALQKKVASSIQYYGPDSALSRGYVERNAWEYADNPEPLKRFEGTHPALMRDRIIRKNWNYEPDLSLRYVSFKDRVKRVIGGLTGWYPGEYKNYTRVR